MTGMVPVNWCKTKLVPTFKGSKYFPSDYRPVGFTFLFRKILERLFARKKNIRTIMNS